MFIRFSRVPFAIAVAAALAFLPACGKKKIEGGHDGPPPDSGSQGSKGGPPPGFGPNTGGQPEPGMPSPPGAGPHLTYNAPTGQSSRNNLKQIGLGFHNYHSNYNTFPAGIADGAGKPGLSWRVAILPYIEQEQLYRQFKLNEPWNSDKNKTLIAKMPKIYAPPGVDTNGYTYYRSFSGQGAIMPPQAQPGQPGQALRGTPLQNVSDGTSNTFLVAEATEPVIWTKPDDLPFTPANPPKLGGAVFGDGFHVLMCDGSTYFVKSSTMNPKKLASLIGINDGQIVEFP